MESTQNRFGSNLLIDWNVVSARFDPLVAGSRTGDAWPQAGMRACLVVMSDPFPQDSPQMSFIQRD